MLAMACAASLVLAVEPPRVVAAVPDHGETGVDPGTAALRIEFDQEMSPSGLSICRGGPLFPKLTGKARWESPRVLVLSVALEPGHEYQMSINCPAFRNTRSAAGEAAEITPIWFATAERAGGGTASGAITPAERTAALHELRRAIDERYSYRDRVVKDWDEAFARHMADIDAAGTRAQLGRAMARLLGEARDAHVSLRIGRALFGTCSTGGEANVNLDVLARVVPGWTRHNETVATGRFEDGVGYLMIASWPSEAGAMQPALDFIGSLEGAPGLVLDVRANGGGDELSARRIAACFAKERAVYSRSRSRDPGRPDGFTEMFDRVVEPAPDGARFAGKVAVLMGPMCMSSNESFILMMRHGAGATLIGDRSAGSSGNPRPVELPCGVTVLLPSWEDYLPDGTLLEGRGIDPDVGVSVLAGQLKSADPVLEAGVGEVRAGR